MSSPMTSEQCLACGNPRGAAHQGCEYEPPTWLSDPRVIQDYEVHRRLGHGGMGETFLATHRRLRAKRVLKGILPAKRSSDFIERFQEEARAASAIRHVNVATLHEFFVCDDGSPVAVWEYIDGHSAAHELHQNGPYPVRVAIELTINVLDGLAAIHKCMVHRDVKPANLMVDRTSGQPVIKIIDFGLAKSLLNTDHSSHIVGTYPYMPLEAWDPDDTYRVSHAADIFAVGAVLYEFLVGDRAFPGTQPQVANKIAVGKDPQWRGPLSAGQPLAYRLTSIIRRALAKVRTDRYQTVEDFRDHLRYALKEFDEAHSQEDVDTVLLSPDQGSPPPRQPRCAREPRRSLFWQWP